MAGAGGEDKGAGLRARHPPQAHLHPLGDLVGGEDIHHAQVAGGSAKLREKANLLAQVYIKTQANAA